MLQQFLVHDSIYAEHAIWYHMCVCLSVRPSVTRVNRSKTVEVRIMQFSPYSKVLLTVLVVTDVLCSWKKVVCSRPVRRWQMLPSTTVCAPRRHRRRLLHRQCLMIRRHLSVNSRMSVGRPVPRHHVTWRPPVWIVVRLCWQIQPLLAVVYIDLLWCRQALSAVMLPHHCRLGKYY